MDRYIADDVDISKPGKGPGKPTFLTKYEVELALDVAKGTRMCALIMAGFMLGQRPPLAPCDLPESWNR